MLRILLAIPLDQKFANLQLESRLVLKAQRNQWNPQCSTTSQLTSFQALLWMENRQSSIFHELFYLFLEL